VVWGVLVASMTLAAGLLVLLDGGPSPRIDGFSLVPMVSATGDRSIGSVFDTRSALDTGRWRRIVIHHSASPVGTAASIKSHAGLGKDGGYHFIIGNGRGMKDGEIHVTYRWLDQLPAGGGLADDTIAICLVGDGNRRPFAKTQIRWLVELVSALNRRLDIPEERVLIDADADPASGPGRLFPSASFREQLASGQ
jgi:hypothetical protein